MSITLAGANSSMIPKECVKLPRRFAAVICESFLIDMFRAPTRFHGTPCSRASDCASSSNRWKLQTLALTYNESSGERYFSRVSILQATQREQARLPVIRYSVLMARQLGQTL